MIHGFLDFFVRGLPQLGVGFLVGCFCPAVARSVKSAIAKEAASLVKEGESAVETAATDVAKKV